MKRNQLVSIMCCKGIMIMMAVIIAAANPC